MTTKKKIRIVDTTLRDGSHSMAHQYSAEQIAAITQALAKAKVDTIEVTHGDGLGGSSIQYGFSKLTDQEALQAAARVIGGSKLAVLLLPGIGIKEDLEMAYQEGSRVARIATHVTEADISAQHIKLAKEIGMEVIGFLMLSHIVPAQKVLEQAKLMESYGTDVVYVVDSAGAMLPDDVKKKVSLLKQNLSVQVGFHAHNNLGLAIGNTVSAIEEGAEVVDGCLAGMGAGAGNTPTEVLVAVLNKLGYETGVDLYAVMDAAEDIVRPLMQRPQVIDKAALSLGYAGVYSSFMLHTFRAASKYGLDPRDILIELGKRKVVGGQEDMIMDVALEVKETL
ncbi:4-hydroxy-2-oxovalerate aldolase [Desulfitobacterium sp.]|uniref:4-hydroxy-2-oxovalerate aldolase n=1 Tax=Desulfitobacterium sp. TaxID=49981 RepID=UPI002B661D69|nr:4-hydroxy-2-oxovalerate aldolase [Desulfitobacterium sp.]HVJ49613.1 4-hydroxy-2-oxovalerate aldolase [Desulfitobacterium sp.]